MAGAYHFQVGDFECAALSDGSLKYPIESLFANVPRGQVEEALRKNNLPTEHVETPYTCLFVNTGQHRVLIDTGAGNLAAAARTMFPQVDNSTSVTGTLRQNLDAIGVEPDDVDVVVFTHAHPDHVGGTLKEDGELVFANARYFIAKDEWEYWTSGAVGTPAPMTQVAQRNLTPLQERVILMEDGDEIVPGIRAVASPGHTPGHTALLITSGGQQLLHISDVVLYPLHLEYPEWIPVFDIDGEQAAASKHRLLDQAAEEAALVFAHHFPPFPNLGYVLKQEEGWRWQPLTPG